MILRTVRILHSNLNVYGSRSSSVDRYLTIVNRNCCVTCCWFIRNGYLLNNVVSGRCCSVVANFNFSSCWLMSFTLRLSYSNLYCCMILRTILIRNGYRNIESTRLSAIWNSLIAVNSNAYDVAWKLCKLCCFAVLL